MSNKVWTTTSNRSDNLRLFGLSFPGKFDYPELYQLEKKRMKTDEEKKRWLDLQKIALEIGKPYRAGKKIDTRFIPTTLYGNSIDKDFEFPSFCRTLDGFLLINEKCANVLKKFRLGETRMYPVSFFDLDLNEPVNNHIYYFLNIAEWRNYFIPDYSKKIEKKINKNENYEQYWIYYADYADYAVAVLKEINECDLDLWHDPALTSSIFVSDELKNALDESGMGTDWLFYNCLIIN